MFFVTAIITTKTIDENMKTYENIINLTRCFKMRLPFVIFAKIRLLCENGANVLKNVVVCNTLQQYQIISYNISIML